MSGALNAAIPAFLISGDTAPDRLREASASGYQLVHKPVPAMVLRATLNRLLKAEDVARRSSRAQPYSVREPGKEPIPNDPAAMTASVRLVTRRALKIAET
jgi:hypothetical protein